MDETHEDHVVVDLTARHPKLGFVGRRVCLDCDVILASLQPRCRVCGKLMVAFRLAQETCSDACRQRVYRQRTGPS